MAGNSDRILLVDNEDPSVSFLDATSLEKITTLALPPLPHEVILDEDKRVAYVCVTYKDGYYNNYKEAATLLQVVDVDAMELREVIDLAPHYAPHGMAFSPDRSLLYVTCESNGGEIVVVDLEARQVAGAVGVGAHGPHWMAALPDGTKAYTANKEAPFVSVVDLKSLTKIGEIPTPSGTEGIASTRDGRAVYASSQRSPELYVIDTAEDKVVETIALPEPPGAVNVTHDDSKVLITYFNFTYWEKGSLPQPGYFQVLDRASGTLSDRVQVGRFPINVGSSRDDRIAYVTCYPDHTMSAIDLDDLSIVAQAEVAKGPHGFALVEAQGTR